MSIEIQFEIKTILQIAVSEQYLILILLNNIILILIS